MYVCLCVVCLCYFDAVCCIVKARFGRFEKSNLRFEKLQFINPNAS